VCTSFVCFVCWQEKFTRNSATSHPSFLDIERWFAEHYETMMSVKFVAGSSMTITEQVDRIGLHPHTHANEGSPWACCVQHRESKVGGGMNVWGVDCLDGVLDKMIDWVIG
jgi:hypothetical protein